MKVLIALFGLLFSVSAQAVTTVTYPQKNTPVIESASEFAGCFGVSVPSMTVAGNQAVAVLNGTSTASGFLINGTAGVRGLIIADLDSSANLYCGDSINVSTPTATGVSGTTGLPIAGNAIGKQDGKQRFPLAPNQQWYCVNDSTSKAVNAAVCVWR